jgi:hypothetical protein
MNFAYKEETPAHALFALRCDRHFDAIRLSSLSIGTARG